MLSLAKIKLHNICQYFDHEVELAPGMSAVVGRNGIGKSNLCRALVYGLTGIVDGSWGSQTDLQKDGTTDPGYVQVEMRDGNVEYTVRRYSIKPNAGKTFQDALTIVKGSETSLLAVRRKEVNTELEKLYGVSCQILFQICWVRQGRLDALMTAPAGVINPMLQLMFSMQRFEKVRDVLATVIGDVARFPDVSYDISQAEKALAELALPGNIADLKARRELLAKTRMEFAVATQGGAMSMSERDKALVFVQKQAERLREFLDKVKPKLGPRPDVPESLDVTQFWSQYNSLRAEIDAVKGRLHEQEMERGTQTVRFDAVYPNGMLMLDEHNKMYDKLKDVPKTCHLCGGTVVNVEAYSNARCKMLTGCDTFKDWQHQAAQEEREHNERVNKIRSKIDECDKRIAELKEVLEKHETEMKLLEDMKEAVQAFGAWSQLESEIRSAESSLKMAEADIEKYQTCRVYPDDVDVQMRQLDVEIADIDARLDDADVAAKRQSTLQTMLDMYKAQQEKAELSSKVINVLTTLRDLFSAGNAQSIYLNGRIDMMNNLLDEYMKAAEMPFRLYLDKEEHVFKYETADGFLHPADHLSGAQKSMSAVALQMALITVVAPNINVCILDEPAEALDGSNKVLMADMLARMSRMLPSVDGTMLVVTRDQQIIDSCGSTIEIGEQS